MGFSFTIDLYLFTAIFNLAVGSNVGSKYFIIFGEINNAVGRTL